MINSMTEVMNPSHFRVIRVYSRELARHFKRKGFDVIGEVGDDGVSKPTQYNLYGDIRKLTSKEKPYIEFFGKLKKKGDKTYGKA